jgi:hypothetical protein
LDNKLLVQQKQAGLEEFTLMITEDNEQRYAHSFNEFNKAKL